MGHLEPLVSAGLCDTMSERRISLATQIISGAEPVDTSRYECIDGQLIERPVPNIQHSRIQENLCLCLAPRARARGLQSGPELSVDRSPGSQSDWMTPDYALSLPGGYRTNANGHAVPPVLLVAEVLSPGQSFFNMRAKAERYLAWGVQIVWLLDPQLSTALVFDAGELSSGRLVRDGELRAGDIAVPLADLFV